MQSPAGIYSVCLWAGKQRQGTQVSSRGGQVPRAQFWPSMAAPPPPLGALLGGRGSTLAWSEPVLLACPLAPQPRANQRWVLLMGTSVSVAGPKSQVQCSRHCSPSARVCWFHGCGFANCTKLSTTGSKGFLTKCGTTLKLLWGYACCATRLFGADYDTNSRV